MLHIFQGHCDKCECLIKRSRFQTKQFLTYGRTSTFRTKYASGSSGSRSQLLCKQLQKIRKIPGKDQSTASEMLEIFLLKTEKRVIVRIVFSHHYLFHIAYGRCLPSFKFVKFPKPRQTKALRLSPLVQNYGAE